MTNLEKEIDKIIVKILLPITDSLKSKTKEIKQKRLELKKEIYNIRQLKQSLIEKRKKLNKQKIIYERQMNGDFSNIKTCQECLTNYINIMDKKQTDFLKDKDDYYELKLRRKQLEFNNLLIDIIKEKTNIEKKKNIKRKMSFDAHGKLNKSDFSIKKDLNKSFKSTERDKSKSKLKNKSITPKRAIKSQQKNNNNINIINNKNNSNINKRNKNIIQGEYKDKKINKNMNKTKSNKSIKSKNKESQNVSGEIEKLINDYASKKNEKKHRKSENYKKGLLQLKEINKDTKNIENDLKEMMNNFLNDENLL